MLKLKVIEFILWLNALTGKLDFEAQRLDIDQSKKYYSIEDAGYLPIPEISGLTLLDDKLYAITDSGGKAEVYEISTNLVIMDTIEISNARNTDWESITSDDNGNFYIADIGNNSNTRKNLMIYQHGPEKHDSILVKYNMQQSFPPEREHMNFDSEATFWHNNNIHLFSKNRGKKCVKHYIFPANEGIYILFPEEELWLNSMITGAAVNPALDLAVLSGYGKIYFFKMNEGLLFSNPVLLIESTRFGQNEAIVFLDKETILLANEVGEFFKIKFKLPEDL